MVSKLWSVMKPLLPWIIAIAVVLSAGAWLGSLYTASRMQDDIRAANAATANVQHQFDTYKTDVATQDAEREKQNQQQLEQQIALAEAYRKSADELAAQLLAKNNELTLTRRKLEEKINALTLKDGAGFTGIGPRALCLYSANLGYPSGPECSQYLSAANGGDAGYSAETGSTSAGLSPAGLLRHSGGYGEWCQVLRNKLNTLRQLYGKEPQ
ncbi:hypothetical protein CBW58_02040 [Yersinia frederiksenii]|nr:hypothetical protein CBW58_02040 [Yersinia frederiksenii]